MGDLRPAVLIVEDDKDFAENLQDILEDDGYDISLSGTIACAREFLCSGCPDVILMDLNLPDGDGADFLGEIRGALPDTEVVVITGHASMHSTTTAINTHAFGYLIKPVDIDQLRMMIRRAVEGKRAAAALRESEAKYRRIVETSLEGIWAVTADATNSYVNDEMARMLGYSPEDMIGRPLADFLTDEAMLDQEMRVAERRSGQSGRYERAYRHADGSKVYCMVSVTPVMGDDGEFHGSFAMVMDITKRKQAEKALLESNERLRMLSRQLVTVQETERRNIGRELHDQIGGSLTALSIALKMNPKLAPELVGDLTARIRELSLDLRPPMLDDLGLVPALIWHFERYTAQTKVQVDFKHMVTEPRYSQEIETAAYRIAQEALTNAARHAGVQDITVRVFSDEVALQIQVEDHGAGFDLDTALSRSDTNGLSGMMEWASLLGGELVVESSPGKGTSLTATLPLA